MNYNVKILKSDEGYAAWCEDLPGCASQGKTEDEAINNIKEAIQEYVSVRDELSKNEKLIEIEI